MFFIFFKGYEKKGDYIMESLCSSAKFNIYTIWSFAEGPTACQPLE